MEKAELKIDYTVYRESYPEGYEDLCRAALEVTKNAYCVYSGFAVGAAVLMNNGEVVAVRIRKMLLILLVCVPSELHCFMPVPLIRRRGLRQLLLLPVSMVWKWMRMLLRVGPVGK